MMTPPIILLHGCGGSPEQAFERTGWIDLFRKAGRDVRALRLPGHGRASPSHDPEDYADLASSLLPELPERSCDLVGFSLGAKIALDIAVRFPDRVHRLVLGGIGDNAFAPEVIGEAAAKALERGADETTPPPVRAFLDTWDATLNDPRAIAAVLRRPANPQLSASAIAAIAMPVIIVNGSSDIVANLGRRLIDALRVEQILLPGVGHFDLTAQRRFGEIALRFLSENPENEGSRI